MACPKRGSGHGQEHESVGRASVRDSDAMLRGGCREGHIHCVHLALLIPLETRLARWSCQSTSRPSCALVAAAALSCTAGCRIDSGRCRRHYLRRQIQHVTAWTSAWGTAGRARRGLESRAVSERARALIALSPRPSTVPRIEPRLRHDSAYRGCSAKRARAAVAVQFCRRARRRRADPLAQRRPDAPI